MRPERSVAQDGDSAELGKFGTIGVLAGLFHIHLFAVYQHLDVLAGAGEDVLHIEKYYEKEI